MRKAREEMAKSEADTAEKARALAKAKAREKAEISRISAKSRYKVDPEAEVTARAKDKYISTERVAAEADAETRVRVEAKDEVRDQDVGVFTEVLNKFKNANNGLKREIFVSEE